MSIIRDSAGSLYNILLLLFESFIDDPLWTKMSCYVRLEATKTEKLQYLLIVLGIGILCHLFINSFNAPVTSC